MYVAGSELSRFTGTLQAHPSVLYSCRAEGALDSFQVAGQARLMEREWLRGAAAAQLIYLL